MSIKREQWNYLPGYKVWLGKYRNSRNLPHWHYDCELLYVERGSLEVYCDGRSYEVEAGNSFFIDSENVHHMQAESSDTIVLMIVFDYSLIAGMVGGNTPESPLLRGDCGIPALFKGLREEMAEVKPLREQRVALQTALHVLNIFSERTLVKRREEKQTLDRFHGLLSNIEGNIEFWSLKEAAGYMCMNESYFSRLFHRIAGVPFSTYLNYARIKRAIALLKENPSMAITDVATRSGFNTIRNFNRIFKATTGYTPKALPEAFTLPELLREVSEASVDPTMGDCELIE